ncbi:hypothetical protein [Streptococcus suis]|uniref:hypothetical protein n=1 Tax=Streptococcus suis TaxID=1307 RepID=UPI000CF581E8|nr:hypothetical protein [Streptococcus suis]
MKPLEHFNQLKHFLTKKDFDGAKNYLEKHKDEFGTYLIQAKKLLKHSKTANGFFKKFKGLF